MANFRDGTLEQGQAMPAVSKTVLLTADNQAISIGIETLLLVGSDNTTATNRTFTLTPSVVGAGHMLRLIFNTGSSTTAQLVDTGTAKLNGDWLPVQYDSLTLVSDGTNWVEVDRAYTGQSTSITLTDSHILVGNGSNIATDVALSGDATIANTGALTIANLAVTNAKVSASAAIAFSKLAALTSANILVGNGSNVATSVALSGDATLANTGALTIGAGAVGYAKTTLTGSVAVADMAPAVMVEATGTLTQANIQAMNGTPVTLVAAPGSGKLIIVDEIELLHTYSTAAYTNGGDVSIQYNTSATPIEVFDVALVTATSTQNFIWKPSASYTSTASTSSQTDLSTSANKAVEITNATAAFATGNAANIFKYRVRYHTVTLLT